MTFKILFVTKQSRITRSGDMPVFLPLLRDMKILYRESDIQKMLDENYQKSFGRDY